MSAINKKPPESHSFQRGTSTSQQVVKPLCQTHHTELVCLTCLANIPAKIEKFYTPKELAERLGCSPMTVRRWFAGAPNVVVDRNPANLRGGKRRYALMRIPESTVRRWMECTSWKEGVLRRKEQTVPPAQVGISIAQGLPKPSSMVQQPDKEAAMLAATAGRSDRTRLALVNQRTDSRKRQDGTAATSGSQAEIVRSSANDSKAIKDEPGAHDDGEQLSLLTRREREVFQELQLAKSDKEIASALRIEVRTARFHVSNILHKLGKTRRIELLAKDWPQSQ